MPEQVQKILDKILEWWKKFNTRQRAILISSTAVVILALVILAVLISKPDYTELITCEDSAQASEVKKILDGDSSIDYRVDNSLVFMVNKDDEVNAVMLLGENQIPSTPYSIENVTSGSLSQTASDKEKLYKDYLEKKFADHLEKMNFVKSASVDIDLPDDDGTILSSDKEGTAAVKLDLKSEISDEQAYGIARFVATELGNASTAGITVIDYDANVLYSGAEQDSTAGIASSQLSVKEKNEKYIKKEIEAALTESGVFSNISTMMNLDMNFDQTETAESNWSYPEGMTESLLNSSSLYDSTATNGSAAVPGTSSNDGDVYYTEDNAYSEQTISDYDYDWLNDHKITKTTKNGGSINYDNSSVSIVATRYVIYNQKLLEEDGTLGDDMTWEQFKAQNGDTKKVEEVDEDLLSAIRTATGFKTENITFLIYETPSFIDKETSQISFTDIAQILIAVLIFALLGFVVFRSTRSAKEEEPEPELSVETLLESTLEAQESLEDIGYTEKSEARLLIEKFVDENPEAVALLLRNWLNDDWE